MKNRIPRGKGAGELEQGRGPVGVADGLQVGQLAEAQGGVGPAALGREQAPGVQEGVGDQVAVGVLVRDAHAVYLF